jgi:hypothetical protein
MTTRPDLNKPKDYLIINNVGGTEVAARAKSFKDALLAINPYGLLKKALEAFDDTDVDEIVKIYNSFSIFKINQVYVIEEKIYDAR